MIQVHQYTSTKGYKNIGKNSFFQRIQKFTLNYYFQLLSNGLKMFKKKVIISILFAFIFISCKKYEESQNFTILTPKDRFARSWILQSYDKDGITTDVSASDPITILFKKNSTYVKTTIMGAVTSTELGRWNLNAEKTYLEMLPLDSTIIQETEIIKLTNKEFKVREFKEISPVTYKFVVQ